MDVKFYCFRVHEVNGRDFINRVGAVCLPDDIVVIKNKN